MRCQRQTSPRRPPSACWDQLRQSRRILCDVVENELGYCPHCISEEEGVILGNHIDSLEWFRRRFEHYFIIIQAHQCFIAMMLNLRMKCVQECTGMISSCIIYLIISAMNEHV